MSKPKFGERSLAHLATVHPDIAKVVLAVMDETTKEEDDFAIICGLRKEEDQELAYRNGTSNAPFPKSYHNASLNEDGSYNFELSDALDAVPWPIEWPNKKTDTPLKYIKKRKRICNLMHRIFKKAEELKIKLEWGGMFKSFFDSPHVQRKR